jgi:hypothetical protein
VTADPEPFSPARYEAVLDAAEGSGYRFRRFERGDPEAGDLLLRHDVDMSLEAAVALAELEARRGVRATYFLMTESVFYNLHSRVGRRAFERLRELGHAIGYHAVWPNAEPDPGFDFDPVLAWHTPEPPYMSEPVPGLANAMERRFTGDFAWSYRSDSNMRWRRGDPLPDLRAGRFPWLQLVVHPEWWVHRGTTLLETVNRFLDYERQLRFERMRDERIEV